MKIIYVMKYYVYISINSKVKMREIGHKFCKNLKMSKFAGSRMSVAK